MLSLNDMSDEERDALQALMKMNGWGRIRFCTSMLMSSLTVIDQNVKDELYDFIIIMINKAYNNELNLVKVTCTICENEFDTLEQNADYVPICINCMGLK